MMLITQSRLCGSVVKSICQPYRGVVLYKIYIAEVLLRPL